MSCKRWIKLLHSTIRKCHFVMLQDTLLSVDGFNLCNLTNPRTFSYSTISSCKYFKSFLRKHLHLRSRAETFEFLWSLRHQAIRGISDFFRVLIRRAILSKFIHPFLLYLSKGTFLVRETRDYVDPNRKTLVSYEIYRKPHANACILQDKASLEFAKLRSL